MQVFKLWHCKHACKTEPAETSPNVVIVTKLDMLRGMAIYFTWKKMRNEYQILCRKLWRKISFV